MRENWVDDASRALAQSQSRRDLLGRFLALLLGSLTFSSRPSDRALAQSECGYGEVACGFSCVDVSYDDQNCGYCGNGCSRGSFCINGQCEGELDDYRDTQGCYTNVFCDDGYGSYVCAELDWDSLNCGSCGVVCPGGSSCVSGECFCNIGEFCYSGSSALCVDTEWDRLNCGSCGNACEYGSDCITGHCSQAEPIATQQPSAEKPSSVTSSVPFGLDAVTNTSLTESRFAKMLPRSFTGFRFISDTTAVAASELLYADTVHSKTFFYENVGDTSSTALTLANVTILRDDRSMGDMLIREQRACRESPECEFLGQNLSLDSQFPFQYQRFTPQGSSAFVYFLAWGQQDGIHLFTFIAPSVAALEDLATAFVSNAKADPN